MVGSLHSLRNHMLQLLQWRFRLLVATGPVSRILYLLPAFIYQGLWPDTIRASVAFHGQLMNTLDTSH